MLAAERQDIEDLECRGRWNGLCTALLCEREVIDPASGAATTGRRQFMTPEAAELALFVLRRWQAENTVHWQPDMLCREEAARARADYAATNLSLIRKSAGNLLRFVQPDYRLSARSQTNGPILRQGTQPFPIGAVVFLQHSF